MKRKNVNEENYQKRAKTFGNEVEESWECLPEFLDRLPICQIVSYPSQGKYTSYEECTSHCKSTQPLPLELQSSILSYLSKSSVAPLQKSSKVVLESKAVRDFVSDKLNVEMYFDLLDRLDYMDMNPDMGETKNIGKITSLICAKIRNNQGFLSSKEIMQMIWGKIVDDPITGAIKYSPIIICILKNPSWYITSRQKVNIFEQIYRQISGESATTILKLLKIMIANGLLNNLNNLDIASLLLSLFDTVIESKSFIFDILTWALPQIPNDPAFFHELIFKIFSQLFNHATYLDSTERYKLINDVADVIKFLQSSGIDLSSCSNDSPILSRLVENGFNNMEEPKSFSKLVNGIIGILTDGSDLTNIELFDIAFSNLLKSLMTRPLFQNYKFDMSYDYRDVFPKSYQVIANHLVQQSPETPFCKAL